MASFPRFIVQQAWDRQQGLCAGCGKTLVRGNQDKGEWGAWHAHHRKPRKDGGSDMLRNCVILCINEPEKCHKNIGHGGDWGNYAQLSDWELPCLYGEKTRGMEVTAINVVGFPDIGGLGKRRPAKRGTPTKPLPPPGISISKIRRP